ncbi:MAG: Txe/YoeB family addiction module toxin [Bacteroidaceae bacterium]|jgi:toxin YoeB|nr:Txe/YoeB family addiction module toxin [Bacteroidaceae bacterium]MBR5860176.1 Txe/YoeB family addiction module toxin [Bacteroidaceae bacterium]
MTYNVLVTKEAQNDLKKLLQSEQQAYKKALKLIAELYEHPRTGTGKPEQLTGNRSGQWSRRISNKHRLVYEIHDTEVVVLVLTAYGHYGDK